MCTLQTGGYGLTNECGRAGSIKSVYVMKYTDFSQATTAYSATGVTRSTFTAITSLPATSVYKIAIDRQAENSFTAEPVDGNSGQWTQTLTFTRRNVDLNTAQLGFDLAGCCDLVAFVERPNNEMFVIGILKPESAGAVAECNNFEATSNYNTGATATDTPTTTYVITGAPADNSFILLSAAAKAAVLTALA